MARPKSPTEGLQSEWYQRLADSGFEDIEDTTNPDRPLKEWHSHKFHSDRVRIRQDSQERYDHQLETFINRIDFRDICKLMADHGNCVLTPKKVGTVIELHRAGFTQRAIAKRLRRSQKSVHTVLCKARAWMKVS